MSHRIIEVVGYDSNWPQLFKIEYQLLSEILGANALAIEHIGSTSVPQLSAKPIIDILVEVECLNKMDEKNSEMEATGYLIKGENGISGRRYFQKGRLQRTHHVHAFQTGDSNLIRHRAFKHYLIAHPEIATTYTNTKIEAARGCHNDSMVYMASKNDFIQRHEVLAVNWFREK